MEPRKLGERIRKYRDKLDITRAELAERAALDEAFIEAVEEREAYPSLGPLLKLSRALGVRLGTFMDDEISSDPLIIRKDERQESLRMHADGDRPASFNYFSLGRGKTDRHMEPFFIQIEPGEEDRSLSAHEGEEFIIVVSGTVELLYGTERYELKAGDSLYYNSVVPHHLGNAGDEKAEIYAILYFPE